ncbi:MAG: primosomal protein N', partial [Rhodospirillaceae bacterium]
MTAAPVTPPATPDEFSTGARVAVLLPLPVSGAYDYLVPEDSVLAPGDVVEVPIGRRFETGVVWGAGHGDVAESKLKDVVHRLDVPSLPGVLLRFIDWVAGYTLQPPGAVLRMTINPIRRGFTPKPVTAIVASGRSLAECGVKATPAREKVLSAIGTDSFSTATALANHAKVSAGVIRSLLDAGVLTQIETTLPSPFDELHPNHAKTLLEDAQNRAVTMLLERFNHALVSRCS